MMKTELLLAAIEKPAGNNEISRLNELFIAQLQEMYWAEKSYLKFISKMARKASHKKLKEILGGHEHLTKKRLGQIGELFILAGSKIQPKECRAMCALLQGVDLIMQVREKGIIRDAAMIKAIDEAGLYRVTRYGILRTFTIALRLDRAAMILHGILDKELRPERSFSISDLAFPDRALQARAEPELITGKRGFTLMPEYT